MVSDGVRSDSILVPKPGECGVCVHDHCVTKWPGGVCGSAVA
jgi:hypothetical protein